MQIPEHQCSLIVAESLLLRTYKCIGLVGELKLLTIPVLTNSGELQTINELIMRIFYEEWDKVLNHQPTADDLVLNEKLLLVEIHQPVADEFNWSDFLSIGFSHHTEIISKAKTLEARLFYIHECAIHYWSKYTLRDYLKADL